jgi:hypothetical protein
MLNRRSLATLAVVAPLALSACGSDEDRIAELEQRLTEAQSSLTASGTSAPAPEDVAAQVDEDPAFQAVDDTPDYYDATTPEATLDTYFRLIGDARFEDACGLVDQTLRAYWYNEYQVDCVVYLATEFDAEDQADIRAEGVGVDASKIEVSGPIATFRGGILVNANDSILDDLGLRRNGNYWSLTYVGPSPASR